MLPSPIWVCVNLHILDAEDGCLRVLLLCTLEPSYMMTKSSGLGEYIMCVAYSLWSHIVEASQTLLCSFLLNKCHECEDRRWRRPGEHTLCPLNKQQMRRTATFKKDDPKMWSYDYALGPKYWHLPPECTLLFKEGLTHTSLHPLQPCSSVLTCGYGLIHWHR